jgi:hypothetical protein
VELFFSVALGAAPASERYDDAVALDEGRLEAILRSISYVGPALGPAALAALLADARTLAARHGDATWSRVIGLWWGARR